MTRQAITTTGAPAAIGPYSQAIGAGDLVFCSGQIGLDPATGNLVDGGIEAQAERALRNLSAVLDAAGCTFADVVKTTIFLADIDDFATVNGDLRDASCRTRRPPARRSPSRRLPKGARGRDRGDRRPRPLSAAARAGTVGAV